ncbi:MAG: hypothetical protein IAE84_02130 [Saprospiraceae bacterium]|jgi:hypothetical protein|nr:hypothetical protein [Saprospiraceae bacterium]HRD79331.1 hypothetical protein [Saprospiraceae bacterium]HRK80987.1 hypothetical protein [Saprospiraceae bacterium]
MYRTLIFAVLFIVSGSTQFIMAQNMAPGHAVLYIYQKGSFGNGQYDLWINGKAVVERFQSRTYFSVQVPAGLVQLRTTGRPKYFVTEKNFRIEAQAGQEYYLEAVLDYDFMSGSLYLVQRSAEDFKKRMKGLKLNEKAKTKLE